MMDLLGQMEQLLGGDEVTAAEYAELFALLLHEARTWAMFPKRRTRSSLTTADRMRLDSPDVCFVLGVSEGKFPKAAGRERPALPRGQGSAGAGRRGDARQL